MKIVILTGLSIVTLLLAACQGSSDVRPTPSTGPVQATVSPLPSATNVPLPSPTAIPLATATNVPRPSPTPTPSPQVLRVDTLVCERFFPGVPNPDGPNERLNVNGSVTNTGGSAIDLSDRPSGFVVELLTAEGALILKLTPEFTETVITPDQLTSFTAPTVNAQHPTAASCQIKTVSGTSRADVALEGKLTTEVTILAAP